MGATLHCRRYGVLCGIVLLGTMGSTLPTPVRAAGPTISIFYPATKAAYDAWNATSSTARPPRTSAFPKSTHVVTFYFEYQGARANATLFTIVVHNHAGATLTTHGPFTLSLGAGLHMSEVSAPAGTYADGTYHADLLVDGHLAGSTAFTVGGARSPVAVIEFYAATKAAADAWNATTSTSAPPRTHTFPAGVLAVAFYFHYRGAKAKLTQFSIVVHAPSGTTLVTYGPYTLEYANGYYMDSVPTPTRGAYPGGMYHVDLLIDGLPAAQLDFGVRIASSAVTIFYPATKAAYDAWNATTSTARPSRTEQFRAGTNVVAFYFEYKGATAKVTQYQLIIRDSTGRIFATHGPYPLSYSAALAMRYVTVPSGPAYPAGNYHADILLDGRVAAGTQFTVGGHGVGITTFYPATKAAFDAWNATTSTARPPKANAFTSGTTIVTFYFEYDGATPKVSQYEIVVRDHFGRVVVTHGPFSFAHSTGLHMSEVPTPSGKAYSADSYRANLLVDGQVVDSAFFTVGAPAQVQPCSAGDVLATCIEPSVLRLHANLPNNTQAEGTGFVIQSDSSGTYLLTNKHVVDGATPRTLGAISPDGRTQYQVLAIKAYPAEESSAGDLAVVKLPATSLRPLTWGDSEHLHLLQQVVSIGYGDAFDLPGPPTVTEGVISALHRDLGDGYGGVWIQHQSFINHGNSGGPLLDMHFTVIGVNTLSQKQTQGIFFAIPASRARTIAQQLIGQMQ